MEPPTLLAILAHPDDEVLCAGALLTRLEARSRVVVLWLSRGELTQAFGTIEPAEVALDVERHRDAIFAVAER